MSVNVYKLIDLIEPYPALYDTKDSQYSNLTHKQYLWDCFAQQLGDDQKAVRRKWDKLRSQYRRELSQLKTKGRTPTWHLFERLAFLEPHTKPYVLPDVSNYVMYPTCQASYTSCQSSQAAIAAVSSQNQIQNIPSASQVANLDTDDAKLFKSFFELYGHINKLSRGEKRKTINQAHRMITGMSKQISKLAKRK